MRRNEGPIDRGIRAALGVVAIVGGILAGGVPAVLLYVVGAVLLVTAAVGWCPLYRVLGVSTCPVPRQPSES
ncbi:DUF2892 domain-containing protein [Propioniciclava coleopterorum]|uniref:DUF2892 domain-containing protein n=1 Tax=Propioniciclava coleopterorum TaxID=2714937 RepID=A0A6G7Y8I6_9ACTN|nr:DUF2892 domain-containing protein [Propioniciclava coleopterorum]QIK73204.1 DUF2892 domain-containing protein [Propioniciclava coleopterorum]